MSGIEDRADNVLRLGRDFAALPDTVFAIWTRPEFVSIWFASSHGFRVRSCAIDLRPGGLWRLETRRGDVVEHPWGVYHEIVPGQRLLYSYHYEGTDFHSTVSIDFAARGDGTRIELCQTGFPDAGAHEGHGRGWRFVHDLVEQALLASVLPFTGDLHSRLSSAERLDGVARDLEAARRRLEAEGRTVLPPVDS